MVLRSFTLVMFCTIFTSATRFWYGELGCVERLHNLFDEMPLRDVVSWTVLISGFVKNHRCCWCL